MISMNRILICAVKFHLIPAITNHQTCDIKNAICFRISHNYYLKYLQIRTYPEVIEKTKAKIVTLNILHLEQIITYC